MAGGTAEALSLHFKPRVREEEWGQGYHQVCVTQGDDLWPWCGEKRP